MRNRFSGVALVTVIIFILLISIIAIAMLNLMSGQAMLIEHQIRRVKAQYVAEAAIWKNFMKYALGQSTETPIQETVDNVLYSADVTRSSGGGPNGTDTVSASVNY